MSSLPACLHSCIERDCGFQWLITATKPIFLTLWNRALGLLVSFNQLKRKWINDIRLILSVFDGEKRLKCHWTRHRGNLFALKITCCMSYPDKLPELLWGQTNIFRLLLIMIYARVKLTLLSCKVNCLQTIFGAPSTVTCIVSLCPLLLFVGIYVFIFHHSFFWESLGDIL